MTDGLAASVRVPDREDRDSKRARRAGFGGMVHMKRAQPQPVSVDLSHRIP